MTIIENIKSDNKTIKPTIAGILLIIAAVITIFMSITLVIMDASTLEALKQISPQLQEITKIISDEQLLGIYNTCGLVGIVLSVFVILGGILSIKRKLWGVALACSIIGLIMFIFSVIIGGVLSLVAMILLMLSKNEFS